MAFELGGYIRPLSMQANVNWNSGWIEVICGGMFSGKTEELIRRIKRAQIARQKVQIFKPVIDDRYATDQVASHSELRVEAKVINHPEEILSLLEDYTRVVAIDEAQFFKPLIVEICHRMANRGLRVIVAGLDLDYRGMPFGPIPSLMATAEMVTKMSAICTACGAPASRSQRLEGSNERSQILVGAADIYEPRCRRCFEPPPME